MSVGIEDTRFRFTAWSSCTFRVGRRFTLDPPLETAGVERPGLGDQCPRGVHLAPGIPQQHAADSAALEVVDHALAERLFPVGERLLARVEVAYRLVAELEEIRIEEREVV